MTHDLILLPSRACSRRTPFRPRPAASQVSRPIRITALVLSAALGAAALSACSGMSRQQQNTAAGAAVGGAAGAVLTGGSAIGTVGGAVIGGVIGDQVSPDDKKKK